MEAFAFRLSTFMLARFTMNRTIEIMLCSQLPFTDSPMYLQRTNNGMTPYQLGEDIAT